ncbi:MAG: RluA family pseudouridine synthase [Flavobacteriales bacterium]
MKSEEREYADREGGRYEHYKFIAGKGQSPLRVDKFLVNFIENASRNKIQQAVQAGNILVNKQPIKSNCRVKAGDEVTVVLSYPPRIPAISPENIALDIVYEDEQLIVIDKEPDMVVHPGHGNWSGTLVNALVYHFENLPSRPDSLHRPGLVHRIDKGTSGLLVVAKTPMALDKLARQFFNKSTQRQYLALIWGNPKGDRGTLRGNLGRNPRDRMQMCVLDDPDQGKPAVTHYEVVERLGCVTLVACRLETGRTHQIRAHFTHMGHPLFNDARYGGDTITKGFQKYAQFVQNSFKIMPRQALHAKTLGFTHPTTGVEMRFDSPLPADFSKVIDRWRIYTTSRPVS